MNFFEFVTVMVSIVLGVSLAQLLSGIAELIREETRIRTFLPHTLWTLALILIHPLIWWSTWDFHDVEWNYLSFCTMLSVPLMLFFLSTLIMPKARGESVVSLEEHFYENRVWFLSIWIAFMAVVIIDGPFVFGLEKPFTLYRGLQVAGVIAMLVAILTPIRSVQTMSALVMLAFILLTSFLRINPGIMPI